MMPDIAFHVGRIGILVHNANYTPKGPSKGVIHTENHPDGSITYTKIIDGEEISVTYNKEGFPDFTPFTHPDYPNPVLIRYSGDRRTDYRLANEKVGRGRCNTSRALYLASYGRWREHDLGSRGCSLNEARWFPTHWRFLCY